MSDDRQRFDNNDWHEGMILPSRKDTHNRNRKKKAKQASAVRGASVEPKAELAATTFTEPVAEPAREPVVEPVREPEPVVELAEPATEHPLEDHPALQEIQLARAEATATSAVTDAVRIPDVSWAEKQARLDDDRTQHEEAAGDDVDPPPFFTTWQRVMLWTGTALVTLCILAWGKIGYVHNVPDIVRHNVSAYDRGPAFLVVKPWWFGPPVIDLAQYDRPEETPNWELYHARLGDYAGIVENPHVLWYYRSDFLLNSY
ncbi:hypothetical protein [Tumebacillus permanentifrigoris]|uniref:Uncharacterized protein n=1 Tax=Tumebacillus permanentifrigoris TaxID=378543 RepID=A0A316DIT3_9BACL|nr:hypothetical protein [Tumebacillus permanentifrigoris]PWK16543.1 hypothetical protein C7459_101409 [Tumebacillus permanentifrigoris]